MLMMPSGRVSWRYVIYVGVVLVVGYLGLYRNEVSSKIQQTETWKMAGLGGKEEYLAFCIAAKNQSIDMPEFLRHHYHHMNVSRFYIMDDASEPPLSTFQYAGVPREALTFQYWHKEVAASMPKGVMQTWIYSKCIEMYGKKHTWMAFFDVDEFLEVRKDEDSVEQILREFEKNPEIGALGVNWRMHTSAGLLTRPESVRASFTKCFDTDFAVNDMTQDERHCKSIVRTDKYVGPITPHMFETTKGTMTAGEDGLRAEPGNAWRFPISWNRLALHHYVVKSKQEYQDKIDRWKDDTGKDWGFFEYIEGHPQINCTEMQRYNP